MRETRFKETEIGMIPEDWEVKTIGTQCSLYGRIGFRGYTKNDLVDKGFGAITFSPSDIHDFHLDYSDCDYISFFKYEESPEIKVFNGDIIFCKTASIGKCALVEGLKEKATINPQFVVLKSIKCNNRFLFYILIDKRFQDRILSITGGSTIPTMSQEKLKLQKFACPSTLKEQTAIAEALSEVDGLLRELGELIEKKKAIKMGMMQELLTVEAVPGKEGAFRPKRRLKGFEGDWVEKRFCDVFEHIPSKLFQIQTNQYLDYGVFPVVDQGQNDIVGYSNDENHVFHVPEGGVVIFGDHTRIVKYRFADFVVGADGTQLLLGTNVDTHYLYYYLGFMEIPNLGYSRHFKYVKEGVYFVPSMKTEQTAIAEVLSDMDAEIAALEAKRAKYEQVKNGMMQELLTGKIRLV